MIGWQLITTDGTSLLGGDGSWHYCAGQLACSLQRSSELKHPRIALAFDS